MTADRPRRILTVCMGCHCRAPLAAAVLAARGGDAVEVRSAGIRDWHVGRGAHPVMIEVAAEHGYDLSGHRGVQVSEGLLAWADVVLAMDARILEALRDLAGRKSGPELKLYLGDNDVPDPWEKPREAFTECVTAVEAGAHQHLERT
ncbi:low molecular weight phosphotyrosine protein phosphatase [Streptomyces sp. NPDC127118]|uniref:arsenate reductase/protein-tyrosine-phosphatase family protein n=1 Tax=Streptomyces sp. NPDC127118 TaxID=3345369 RepID=UPI00363E964B